MAKLNSAYRILDLLGRMIEAHTTAAFCAAEIRAIVLADDRAPMAGGLDQQLRPLLDNSSRTVWWNGGSCRLGPTILFDLLDRLARRPNQYVTHDQLLADVWNAQVSPLTIRSAVRQLRAKLRQAGMGALADAIEGRRGCYGLILDQPS